MSVCTALRFSLCSFKKLNYGLLKRSSCFRGGNSHWSSLERIVILICCWGRNLLFLCSDRILAARTDRERCMGRKWSQRRRRRMSRKEEKLASRYCRRSQRCGEIKVSKIWERKVKVRLLHKWVQFSCVDDLTDTAKTYKKVKLLKTWRNICTGGPNRRWAHTHNSKTWSNNIKHLATFLTIVLSLLFFSPTGTCMHSKKGGRRTILFLLLLPVLDVLRPHFSLPRPFFLGNENSLVVQFPFLVFGYKFVSHCSVKMELIYSETSEFIFWEWNSIWKVSLRKPWAQGTRSNR